jgi:UDP-N-acetylmuramate: L-alanyl-gamma-D-glutamyl-meso-diaminopimelate ligase
LRALKIHLIGIAGTGMGALARLLKEAGHDVRGSDTEIYPPMSDQLARAHIPVALGYHADNLAWDPEAVVVGNVCGPDHLEVLEALRRGLKLQSFPSMLASALLPNRDSLVVAGTHGKTTTTSLLAWILHVAGRDPGFLVGGVPQNFGTGAHLGQGRAIVLEGDEYDTAFFDKGSKFLHYRPKRAVLTGVEYDHVDIFADFDALREVFRRFVDTLDPTGDLVVNLEDAEAMGLAAHAPCRVHSYTVVPRDGDPRAADYTAVLAATPGRRARFEVFERGVSLGEFHTQLVGRFNVSNIMAAIAVARCEGVAPEILRTAIRGFRGVKKRQELIGMAAGVRIIFDFAHHPTAAQLTVTALRKRYPDNALHVCFEPRSSSSRRHDFAEGYAAAFDAASAVYIAPVFRPEKVPDGQVLDTAALARSIATRGANARAFESIEALGAAVLERAVPGDTVVLLSSGSFGDLPRQLLHGFGDPVTFADPDDQSSVADLMDGYGLPAVVPGGDVETLVLRSPAGIDGCVSLQVCETSALLFGLAVAPQRRGQGLGWVLGDIVLRRCRTLGAARCYLITNTATDFFAGKLGFSAIDKEQVDPAIRQAANFAASGDLAGAVYMVLDLPQDGDVRRRGQVP